MKDKGDNSLNQCEVNPIVPDQEACYTNLKV
jgi:hypothetical protein